MSEFYRATLARSPTGATLALLLSAIALEGCGTLGYYGQSIAGQMEVLRARRPIPEMLAAPDTPAALRERLALSLEMREFATRELDLPDSGSYHTYVALDRRYAVWTVMASPELSLVARQWCYPVIGCASYRGYFREEQARLFATRLEDEGYDVTVQGVPAYSTLGWFADPLYSTVTFWPEPRLAELMFHELAHERLYVRGDTTFNESFATVVAAVGVERWLRSRHGPAEVERYREHRRREESFLALVLRTRNELERVFASAESPKRKRAAKALVFARLEQDYRGWKSQWGGYTGYDPWFEGGWNNARLVALATYRDYAPALLELLRSLDGDLAAFYRAASELGRLPEQARRAELSRTPGLAAGGLSPDAATTPQRARTGARPG